MAKEGFETTYILRVEMDNVLIHLSSALRTGICKRLVSIHRVSR